MPKIWRSQRPLDRELTRPKDCYPPSQAGMAASEKGIAQVQRCVHL